MGISKNLPSGDKCLKQDPQPVSMPDTDIVDLAPTMCM